MVIPLQATKVVIARREDGLISGDSGDQGGWIGQAHLLFLGIGLARHHLLLSLDKLSLGPNTYPLPYHGSGPHQR